MTTRARRLADVTRLAMLDRRAAVDRDAILSAGDVAIPRAGDARVVVGGHEIALTNLDRILWPATGFTKAELIAYYLSVADVLVPHLRDRPLTVGRFPGGVDGRGFAQTELPGRPSWLRTVPLALLSGAVKRFTLVDDAAGLAWLAQMGTIELHTFAGALPDLDSATWIVFDLDPALPANLLDAARVAVRIRTHVEAAGEVAWVKTSGSVGLHVLVPVRAVDFRAARAFAARVARRIVAELPALVTDRLDDPKRAGRVLIDVRQNSRRLTTVVPYSLRATDRPTVSMPVTWDEVHAAVASGDASALVFEAADVPARIARVGDVFAALRRRSAA